MFDLSDSSIVGGVMTRGLAIIGLILLLGFALYGGIRLASDTLTEQDGEKAAQAVHPFVKGAASVAQEKVKEALANTPDEQLEKDAELYAKKLYPIAKGALKGQIEAFSKDPNRGEVPEMMRQAGKDVTEKVIKPFTEGFAEGSGSVLKDLDKTVESVRKFTEENRDLIESVTSGLKGLHETLKEHAPLPPPLPGLKPFDRFPPPPLGPAPHMRGYDLPPGTAPDDGLDRNQPADPGYQAFPPPFPVPLRPVLPRSGTDSYDQPPRRVPPEHQATDRNRDAQRSDGWSRGDVPHQDRSRDQQRPSAAPQPH